MSGLCLAVGTADAAERVAAMLPALGNAGGETRVVPVAPDMAVGLAWRDRGAGAAIAGGDVTALVDGEIYDARGAVGDGAGRLLDLYRTGRLADAAHWNGSFNAAVVDATRGRVTILSDRLGTRPLYYWQEGRSFSAAGGLAALLADDRVPRRLCAQGLVEMLSFMKALGAHTHFADVRCLQGAEIASLDGDRLSVARVRRLAWTAPDFDEDEGAARLADALRASVRRRVAGRSRPGLLLSGGIDSRLVLAAASREGVALSCITVASHENREVRTARACAQAAGQNFEMIGMSPYDLSAGLDGATVASDGLYAPPVNLYGTMPGLAARCDLILSGHGIDYTLRGMYLPRVLLRLAGTRTVVPRLRAVADASPGTVAAAQYVAVKADSLGRALAPEVRETLTKRQTDGVAEALAGADLDVPANAWDAYILHLQARHYAYSDFLALDRHVDHRPVPFDDDVLALYFAMPPEWRASGRMAIKALEILSPALATVANANTGVRANAATARHLATVYAGAALRRLGLLARPSVPDPAMTDGSWANFPVLLRRDPVLAARLRALPREATLLDTGLFAAEGLAAVVDEHLEGRADHTKFLLICLALSSWLSHCGYDGAADD